MAFIASWSRPTAWPTESLLGRRFFFTFMRCPRPGGKVIPLDPAKRTGIIVAMKRNASWGVLLGLCLMGCSSQVVCETTTGVVKTCGLREKSDCKGTSHPMQDGDEFKQGPSGFAPAQVTCNRLGYTVLQTGYWGR